MSTQAETIAAAAEERARNRGGWRYMLRELLRDKTVLIMVIFLLILSISAILAPWILTGNLFDPDYSVARVPPFTEGHIGGTDQLGRDVFSRTIYGARISLLVGSVSVLIAAAVGITAGLMAGYYGGWIDSVIMRIVDVHLAFPFILLALTINAIIGLGIRNIIISLAIAGWVEYARIARGEVLVVREREFTQAARLMGASNGRIIWRHIFPNITTPLLVTATLQVAQFIIAEASISFLGFGVQPPTPAWGSMISEGFANIWSSWWMITVPGVALALVVLAVNLVGDWLRDVLDPRLRR
jgi:peptide/nickel transport system permease protein